MVLIIVPHNVEHLSSGKLHGDENINNIILILKIIKIGFIEYILCQAVLYVLTQIILKTVQG